VGKYSAIYNHFARGEVSDRGAARVDLDEVKSGALKTCENFLISKEGSAIYRPSSRFAQRPWGAAQYTTVLLPFIFSETESYVIAISNFGVVAYTNSGAAATIGTTGTCALASAAAGGLLTNISQLRFAQSADVMWVTHPQFKPMRIIRTQSSTFAMVDWDVPYENFSALTSSAKRVLRHPFRDRNITSLTMAPAATTGSGINLVASAAYFDSGHVGALFKVVHSTTEGVARVTSVTNSTTAVVTILVDFGATTASTNWAEGSWSTFRGFPRTVSVFEQRVVYGGNESERDTLWFSEVGNTDLLMQDRLLQDQGTSDVSSLNYFGTAAETDPCDFGLASNEVNFIQWISAGRGTLAVGTLGQEYRAAGGDGRVISASNVNFVPQTAHGSAFADAARVGQSTAFIQRDGKVLRDLNFDFESNADFAADLNPLATHIVRHNEDLIDFTGTKDYDGQQFSQIVYDKKRGVIWALTSRNYLVALTLNKDLQVAAWHRHNLGGTADGTLPPQITSMCLIPSSNGKNDDLYLAVNRQVNSVAVTYIEKIGADFNNVTLTTTSTNDDDHPWFLDCGIRLTHASTTSWGNAAFKYLIGETVGIIADGKVHPDVTIADGGSGLSGTFTTNYAATEVIVGYKYTGKLRLMRIEEGADAQGSSVQTRPNRAQELALYLVKSFYFKYGVSIWDGYSFTDHVDPFSIYKPGQSLGATLKLFTGWKKRLPLQSTLGEDWFFMIQQDLPLPLTVGAVQLRGQTSA
jgi:hypothetical protein